MIGAIATILGLTGLGALAGWQARKAQEKVSVPPPGESTLFTQTTPPPISAVTAGAAAALLVELTSLAKGGVTGAIAAPVVLMRRAKAAALATGLKLGKTAAALLAGVQLPGGLPGDEKWPGMSLSVRDRLIQKLSTGV